MIYIHYNALRHLISLDKANHQLIQPQTNIRITALERQHLRQYRKKLLEKKYPNLVIEITKQGKPLAKNYPQLYFNQSHSQNYYALAYSDAVIDLGIDIEDLSRQVRMHALAKKVFHPNEYQQWQQLEYSRDFWFKIWTIKEAVLKAQGLGIALDLKSLDTKAHPTWDFGRVEHPQLGIFIYQCLSLSETLLTVAYRMQDMQLQPLSLNI